MGKHVVSIDKLKQIGDWGSIRIREGTTKRTDSKQRFIWAQLRTQRQVERANAIYFGDKYDGLENVIFLDPKKEYQVEARPFMRPALAKECTETNIAKAFKNQL